MGAGRPHVYGPAPRPRRVSFEDLRRDLRAFIDERDWDQFHRPKDLAVGLAVEAGELLQEFQWTDPTADEVKAAPEKLEAIRRETADCFMYAMLVADKLGFDVVAACQDKLVENRTKYPVEKSRGRNVKYTDL